VLVDASWLIGVRHRAEGGRDLGVLFGAGIGLWPIRIMRALMRPVTVMAARSARTVQGWPHTSRVTIWADIRRAVHPRRHPSGHPAQPAALAEHRGLRRRLRGRALMRPVTVMAARSARTVQGWPHTSRVTIWAEPALTLFVLVDASWLIGVRHRAEGGRDLGVLFGAGIGPSRPSGSCGR
jgi:tetrahydromethanopterin S-methyltransferase subunit G